MRDDDYSEIVNVRGDEGKRLVKGLVDSGAVICNSISPTKTYYAVYGVVLVGSERVRCHPPM